MKVSEVKFLRLKLLDIDCKIYGGPYMERPVEIFGVNMAREIKVPSNVRIPTEDFKTPEVEDVYAGMYQTLSQLLSGQDIYVGCRGGVGRTGLCMGILAKVAIVLVESQGQPLWWYSIVSWFRNGNRVVFDRAISHVRDGYNCIAVETIQQEVYIADFDVIPLVRFCRYYRKLIA